MLIFLEHLTGWPIARATKDATAGTVVAFLKYHILHSFGPPNTIIIDNASFFSAGSLRAFMKSQRIALKTVAYAQMSNERAERMISNLKKSVVRLPVHTKGQWNSHLDSALHG